VPSQVAEAVSDGGARGPGRPVSSPQSARQRGLGENGAAGTSGPPEIPGGAKEDSPLSADTLAERADSGGEHHRDYPERARVRRASAPSRAGSPNANGAHLSRGKQRCLAHRFQGRVRSGARALLPVHNYRRFFSILGVRAQTGTGYEPTRANLWRIFGSYGLPRVIRCDNGNPFVATRAPAGLTRFGALLVKLGIRLERTEPGKPYQNGSHERFHKTLKAATARPPASTWNAQQKRFDRFRKHYNEVRPHEALDMRAPAALYSASPRPRPKSPPPIEHPGVQRVITVYDDGSVSLFGSHIHLSTSIARETVGVTEVEDDIYKITYGPIYLGHISFRHRQPVTCFAR